jgi:hypothetical protein
LTLAYFKPVLAVAESGLSFSKPFSSSSKPGSSSSKRDLEEDNSGLAKDENGLEKDKSGLAYSKSDLRHDSFTGMDCLSVHWKNFCSARAEIKHVTLGFRLNIWNGTAHKIFITNHTLKKQKERRYKEKLAKKLDPKKIVVCPTKNLSREELRTKVKAVAQAILDNIGTYPSVLPLPGTIITKVADGKALSDDINSLQLQINEKLKLEIQNNQDLNDVVQDKWVGQVQTDADGDVSKVTAVGMAYKGTGPAPDKNQFGTSNPIINMKKINKNVNGQLGLDMLNSATNKKGKPFGAVGYYALRQIGGDVAPTVTNHANMVAGSPHKSMDFIDHFLPAQIGMTVYYMFVWYDVDGNISPLSGVYSFVIPG